MKATITIDSTWIKTGVLSMTGYTAKAIAQGVDNIMMTEDDTAHFNILLERNTNTLLGKLSRFSPVKGTGSIEITVPANYDTSVTAAISEAATEYVENGVLMEWFHEDRLGDDRTQYINQQKECLSDIIQLVNKRKQ